MVANLVNQLVLNLRNDQSQRVHIERQIVDTTLCTRACLGKLTVEHQEGTKARERLQTVNEAGTQAHLVHQMNCLTNEILERLSQDTLTVTLFGALSHRTLLITLINLVQLELCSLSLKIFQSRHDVSLLVYSNRRHALFK